MDNKRLHPKCLHEIEVVLTNKIQQSLVITRASDTCKKSLFLTIPLNCNRMGCNCLVCTVKLKVNLNNITSLSLDLVVYIIVPLYIYIEQTSLILPFRECCD